MVLVLVIGDMHVPHRAAGIPAKFKSLLTPGKIQHILCTGNLCSKEMHDYLKSLASDIHIVKGDFDEVSGLPEDAKTTIGQLKMGICHGHQLVPWGDTERLMTKMRELDVDILISGHTHKWGCEKIDDKLLLNPGSATGAYSALTSKSTPSLLVMDIVQEEVTIFVYWLDGEEVRVEKREYKKPKQEE